MSVANCSYGAVQASIDGEALRLGSNQASAKVSAKHLVEIEEWQDPKLILVAVCAMLFWKESLTHEKP